MKMLLALVAVAALTFAAAPASATLLPPYTTFPPVPVSPVSPAPSGTLLATAVDPFSFATNKGTLTENVYRDSSGFLFFTFQVQVTSGDIYRLTSGDWDNSILIDVEQFADHSGQIAATSADRNGLGTVGINWAAAPHQPPPLVAGKTSEVVVLYTDAMHFTDGTLGLSDTGASGDLNGFVAATPEPATLSLLGFGLLGLGTLRKKLRK